MVNKKETYMKQIKQIIKNITSVHVGWHIESPRNRAPSIYTLSIYLSVYLSFSVQITTTQNNHSFYNPKILINKLPLDKSAPRKTSLLCHGIQAWSDRRDSVLIYI